MKGQIVPVVDIRRRLNLPARELDIDDQFILARTSQRLVALPVDDVVGIRDLTEVKWFNAQQALPGTAYIHGIAILEGDLVLICDLEQFLSFDEEHQLASALSLEPHTTGALPIGEDDKDI